MKAVPVLAIANVTEKIYVCASFPFYSPPSLFEPASGNPVRSLWMILYKPLPYIRSSSAHPQSPDTGKIYMLRSVVPSKQDFYGKTHTKERLILCRSFKWSGNPKKSFMLKMIAKW